MDDPVSTVLLDLDETLCYQPTPGTDRLAGAFDRAGVDPFFTIPDYLAKVEEIGGTDSDVTRREQCFADLARDAGREEVVGLRVADAYEALTDRTAIRYLPNAETVLESLGADYRLGLVTDGGPDTQSVKIDVLGLREHVETVVMAGYETAPKPDPEPFEAAMADLGVDPEETVHVGNSLSTDVAGANAAGIGSVWVPYGDDPDAEHEADYVLETIADLLDRPWLEPA